MRWAKKVPAAPGADARKRHLPVEDRADGVAVHELPAQLETRDGLPRLPGHCPVPLGTIETRHGPGELEVVGQRRVAEVAALVLPGVVVESDGFARGHRRSSSRVAFVAFSWIDTVFGRN
jgi:hypothetical protein